LLVERLERLDGGAVKAAEVRHEGLGGREPPGEYARHRPGGSYRIAEQIRQVPLAAPQHRRFAAGRGRHVPGDDAEHLRDETVRRPCGQANGATRAHGSRDLIRGPLVVRREHDPEDAQHRVERCVRHGQVLGIPEAELGIEPLGRGAPAPAFEQRGNEIDADGIGAGAGRRQCGVAVAARDIEHPAAGPQVGSINEKLADQDDA
jgi:hypothetical protein